MSAGLGRVGGIGLAAVLVWATVFLGASQTAGAVPPIGLASSTSPSSPPSSPPSGSPVTVAVDAAHPGRLINQGLLGVNNAVHGAGAAMQAIGVPWVRTDVNFQGKAGGKPVYDCATGQFNPAMLDARIALDREEGGQPLLVVDYSPTCLATPPTATASLVNSPPDTGAFAAKWSSLVYQMGIHAMKVEGVRAFEIWNQPNDPASWTGTQGDYLTLYADTSRALEAAAAVAGVRIEVGGPALADLSGKVDLSWVRALADRANAQDLPLDFVSWQIFANSPFAGPSPAGTGPYCFGNPPGPNGTPCWYNPGLSADVYGQSAAQVRAVLANYPKLHPKLWIDAWNIDTAYDPRQSDLYGAAFVAAALASAQAAGVDRMCFFQAVDSGTNQLINQGLLTPSDRTKPDYNAMAFWHALAGRSLATAVVPGSQAPGSQVQPDQVGAVAARGSDGTVRVLVYDFLAHDPTGHYGTSPTDGPSRQVKLQLFGLGHRTFNVSRAVIDLTHSGGTVSTGSVKGRGTTLGFSMASESVELLTFSPRADPKGFPTLRVVVAAGALVALAILIILFVVVSRRPGEAA
ncbi:MAG: GH39 family glycosyl hydrolase [Acidimicrobiales bacterium]